MFKSFRQFFYDQFRSINIDQFRSINIDQESLIEFSMNFIVKLSMSFEEFNCIMIVIDKFNKYVRLISNKKIWKIKKWTLKYHRQIYRFWNLSNKIISNKNSKFTNDFWTCLFQKFDVKIDLITTYHFSTNEQNERTNQIVEIAIRCLLIDKYEKNWFQIIFEMKYVLNIAENAFIDTIFFEILYDVKSRETLNLLTISIKQNDDVTNFIQNRINFRNEIYDAIKFAQIKMSFVFDNKHRSFNFIKSNRSNYHVSQIISFSFKKINSFKILQKMKNLIYKLKLSNFMRMHNVVFVIHFEQTLSNLHFKTIFFSLSLIIKNDELYVVEKIFKKEIKNKKVDYLIKWNNYLKSIWKSRKKFIENILEMIVKFEKSRRRWTFFNICYVSYLRIIIIAFHISYLQIINCRVIIVAS